MTSEDFYKRMCSQRLGDLICWVRQVYPGQTITKDYVFKNATLENIAKGSAATNRVIRWCISNTKTEVVR